METDVPFPTTPLIGRTSEMNALHELLDQQRVRLVTLTGAGGSGKSRLAVELANEVAERFDRVWFVDLTTIDAADLVPSAIAQAIGVQESGSGELVAIVREMLSVGRFLLILDNFEHVLAGAEFVARLLATCRGLVAVATSREALGIRAEHVFVVEPLATPTRDDLEDVEQLRTYASVQMFEDRARAALPTFRMRDPDVQLIAEICLDLDGLPLAIELVAAQASVLSPREILQRLSARAPLVMSGPRDLPERHRTLDATVAWSYDLLEPNEQTLFRVAGVFHGGFTLAALTAVLPPTAAAADPLIGLSQLVAKSLIRVSHDAERASRFWMLETIRGFALDRLTEEDQFRAAQRRHAEYYVGFAESLQGSMRGPGMADALDLLAAEYSNFRAVFQWSAAHAEWEIGLRLAGALYRFWMARGHIAEARVWLDAALAQSGDVRSDVRAIALNAAGVMAGVQHDHETAIQFFTDSLRLWEELGETGRQAGVALNLGLVAQNLGQLETAERQFEQAQQLYARVQDRQGEASAIGSRARIARDRGDLGTSRELLVQCLALFRGLGDDWGIANSLANLGHVSLALGDAPAAKQSFREALIARRALGNILHIAECLEGLAGVVADDRPRIAIRLLGAAEVMRETSGAPIPAVEEARYASLVARVRSNLSRVMFKAGWNAGRALSVTGAIELALRDDVIAEETQAQPASTLDGLSAREREIAELIGEGYSNRAIAERLVMSVKTVETHVKHIFQKLNVRNRSAVAVLASRADGT